MFTILFDIAVIYFIFVLFVHFRAVQALVRRQIVQDLHSLHRRPATLLHSAQRYQRRLIAISLLNFIVTNENIFIFLLLLKLLFGICKENRIVVPLLSQLILLLVLLGLLDVVFQILLQASELVLIVQFHAIGSELI